MFFTQNVSHTVMVWKFSNDPQHSWCGQFSGFRPLEKCKISIIKKIKIVGSGDVSFLYHFVHDLLLSGLVVSELRGVKKYHNTNTAIGRLREIILVIVFVGGGIRPSSDFWWLPLTRLSIDSLIDHVEWSKRRSCWFRGRGSGDSDEEHRFYK